MVIPNMVIKLNNVDIFYKICYIFDLSSAHACAAWEALIFQYIHTLTMIFSIAPGYDTATLGFLGFVVFTVKFSGKLAGMTHQIPSVSNSRGRLS